MCSASSAHVSPIHYGPINSCSLTLRALVVSRLFRRLLVTMFCSSTILEFLLFILQPLVLVSGYSGSDCSCRPACPPVRTPFCQPACLVCSQSTCHGRTYLLPELCSSKSVTLTGNSQNCFLSSSSSKKTYSYIRQSCRREHNGKKNKKKLLLISKCVWSQAENVLLSSV